LARILSPGSLIEVLLWSLAAGDAASSHSTPEVRARLKYRPEPVTPLNSVARIQCSLRCDRIRAGTRPRSCDSGNSVFVAITLYRDHNLSFRSVVLRSGGAICLGQFEIELSLGGSVCVLVAALGAASAQNASPPAAPSGDKPRPQINVQAPKRAPAKAPAELGKADKPRLNLHRWRPILRHGKEARTAEVDHLERLQIASKAVWLAVVEPRDETARSKKPPRNSRCLPIRNSA
jgi:hypothetical protein